MKLSLLTKILNMSVIAKATAYKKGSLVLMSLPMSVGVWKSIQLLVKDVEMFDLILPIISITGCVMIYFVFWATDFSWGLLASKHEANGDKDWIKSDKLYNSLGKMGGILLVNFLMLSVILFLVVLAYVKMSVGLLFISVLINVLTILYEVHSIGENIKRRTGNKPKFYTFFDSFTNVLESSIIDRFKKWIE